MRLILLGTGPFAVPTLRTLADSRHQVALVVTRPPQGRIREPSPVQRAAEHAGHAIWTADTVNSQQAQARLAAERADLLVVCDYGEILLPETLAVARLGGINLHGSLLPKYRGAAPVQWAILRGETETGNTVIHMTPGLDAGPILAQQRTPIDPDEDAEQLESRLAAMGAGLVLEVIDALERGTVQPVPQDPLQASKAPRLKKKHGAIDWSRTAQEIKNQVRALRPWPRAFTYWHRKNDQPLRLNIDRVTVAQPPLAVRDPIAEGEAGTVLQCNERLLIACGDGVAEILELQPAGKRSMAAADFLRGYRVEPGQRFGH